MSRAPAGLTAGLAALALATAALAAAGAAPPIRAMLWVPKDADPARALGTAPTECLRPPADPAAARQVEIGRAAFRTPVVLGGQAARAGISCESCHRQGRDNPDFQFPGVSGPPGTADVTSSLFSTHRGNGVFDPKPIPDLSGPKTRLRVDQTPAGAKLETFIHGLVTEEFDGPEPTPATLAGLAAYVRALDPAACPTEPRQPLTVALLMADARRALTTAQETAGDGDRPTAVVMVASARARLGLIDERFSADPALQPDRKALRAADARLAAIQQTLREPRTDAAPALAAWLSQSRPLEAALARQEPRSLFDPDHLAQAAKRRLPR
jgi:hypothetical protein